TAMITSSGRTSSRRSMRCRALLRRPRRAGAGRVRRRGRARPGKNHGPLAGRAPMTAMKIRSSPVLPALRGRRAPSSDGEGGRGLEVESLFDLERGDLVAQPVLLLARGVGPPLTELALAGRVHPAPAGLVACTPLAHR